MQGFTIQRLGLRIKNSWVTDGLSEILCTFILALFVYASGAQDMLTYGAASSTPGKALASGAGLTIAVYAGMKASGGSANPNVSLMFCLLGKMKWKKLPVYIVSEFIGAFLAAVVAYFIYEDLIIAYEGSTDRIHAGNINSTAALFTSFPHPKISKTTGFFDVTLGTSLLTGAIAAIADPFNAGTSRELIPLVFTPMLYGIVMTFGVNTGAAINTAIDLSGRTFAYAIGYGSEVFTHANNWSWVPPVAGMTGAITGSFVYQLMVGNHLPMETIYSADVTVQKEFSDLPNGNPVDLKEYKSSLSMDSIKTVSTVVDS